MCSQLLKGVENLKEDKMLILIIKNYMRIKGKLDAQMPHVKRLEGFAHVSPKKEENLANDLKISMSKVQKENE